MSRFDCLNEMETAEEAAAEEEFDCLNEMETAEEAAAEEELVEESSVACKGEGRSKIAARPITKRRRRENEEEKEMEPHVPSAQEGSYMHAKLHRGEDEFKEPTENEDGAAIDVIEPGHPFCGMVTAANHAFFPGWMDALDYFRTTNDVECLKFFTLLSCEGFIKHDSDPKEILYMLKSRHKIEVYDPEIVETPKSTEGDCLRCRSAENLRETAKMIYKRSALEMIKLRLLHLKRLNRQKCLYDLVVKLVDYTPHIEFSKSFEVTLERAKVCSKDGLHGDLIEDTAQYFLNMLQFLEHRFHPLIRKGHRHTLLSVFDQIYRSECLKFLENFESEVIDYFHENESDVRDFIETKKESSKLYQGAKSQVFLHRAFVEHIYQYAFGSTTLKLERSVEELLDDKSVVPEKFESLDANLIKLSLGEMLKLLKDVHMIHCFLDCINKFAKVDSELLREKMFYLIPLIGIVGLPGCRTEDEKSFHLLLKDIQKNYFRDLSEDYVVLVVMHYHEMVGLKSDPKQLQAFTCNIQKVFNMKIFILKEVWKKGSRFYDHELYRTYLEPLRVLVWD